MKPKYRLTQTAEYKKRKQRSMINMKKMRMKRTVNNGRDFIVLAYGVAGKDRIDSRIKMITKGCKGTDGNI